MPQGDGTGPDGRGGWCTSLRMNGQIYRPQNLARGFRGKGRGRRNILRARRVNTINYPPSNQGIESDQMLLEKQEELTCQQLDRIRRRLDELRNRE